MDVLKQAGCSVLWKSSVVTYFFISLNSHKKRGSIDLVSQSWGSKFLYWLPKLNPSLRHLETFPIERDFLLSLAMWLKRFQADGVGVVARSWDLAQKWRANTHSSSSSSSTPHFRSTVSGMKLPEGEIRLSPPTILTCLYCRVQRHISHRRVSFACKQRNWLGGQPLNGRVIIRPLSGCI